MAHQITRRTLGLSALAGAALAGAQENAPRPYTGALDGFESKVSLSDFDTQAFIYRHYAEMPLRLTFRATNRRDAERWQEEFGAKLRELVGPIPRPAGAPKATLLETREFPDYKREKLVFQSRPGMDVLAYLLTPTAGKPPFVPMICIPGHGRGVDDVVGIDEKGRDRTNKPPYMHDFAIQAVEHGMAAVAIEPFGFGCRRDERSRKQGLAQKACEPSSGAALLMGETMIGWRVADVMRTVDWIETRPELDSKRVGCMGISGGGTCTLFSAALEPRIRAAQVCCYLNTFRDSVMSMPHCIDNYVPGMLQWGEMYDIGGLVAPRPLFIQSGLKDPIFPVKASRESFARLKKIYEVFGAADNTAQEIAPLPHEFSGVEGFPFLVKHLGV
jgi:dienelactone hydrolase